MSLCDTCSDPGSCCRGFRLHNKGDEHTFWNDAQRDEWLKQFDLPFIAIETFAFKTDEDKDYYAYKFGCSALTNMGRCGIYETRPDICRNYKEASDPMCVYFEKDIIV